MTQTSSVLDCRCCSTASNWRMKICRLLYEGSRGRHASFDLVGHHIHGIVRPFWCESVDAQKKLEDAVLSFSFRLERSGHSMVSGWTGPSSCEGRVIQKQSIWCAGLACLSRSSNHTIETDQRDRIDQKNQKDQKDQMNQIPPPRREMLDCKT